MCVVWPLFHREALYVNTLVNLYPTWKLMHETMTPTFLTWTVKLVDTSLNCVVNVALFGTFPALPPVQDRKELRHPLIVTTETIFYPLYNLVFPVFHFLNFLLGLRLLQGL